ncbi:hypothetical protein BAY06_07210 [Elizabethkingia anophelis]|uniref:AbiJ-NTD4 domain-containing protein n=1 Tax=Elizabethkingia anophelis TaxID=1117645 RepID=UPI000999A737|nr:hypothetical protein [Elizabethkingia anophelis]MCT4320906.1 hypothetical protein [Elizabethkingia anophelis]OPC50954.1 hypothetical protein BAY06_07210 [Elizabethkingia anophelis]HAY3534872.1 hypothetical protein [Elizabethkingia anophelis]HAY3546988.1 hypothetical protein [Elizabethkingia anophelis]HAY3591323.1 hypothetical protein [Elizabethkingia anophelis]
MKFSERIGKNKIKEVIQIEGIDEELKNSLWNIITFYYWDTIKEPYITSNPPIKKYLLNRIWIYFFKNRFDEMPSYIAQLREYVKDFFFSSQWFEIYDFIEFLPNNYDDHKFNIRFMDSCNIVLKNELSGYRFINNNITPISNEEELSSINEALQNTENLQTVNLHINRAVELFSDRKMPDYRNSIKESISAVEAFCAIITNDQKATLGQALKKLEDKAKIHPALKKAFSNLYGYTSEANGIRHALLEENDLEQEDAKFMLVSCSAFINYLAAKTNNGSE